MDAQKYGEIVDLRNIRLQCLMTAADLHKAGIRDKPTATVLDTALALETYIIRQ